MHDYLPTLGESAIREWIPEDDYETEVAEITEPDHVTLALRNLVVGFGGSRLFGIASNSSSSPEALSSHLPPVPCCDSDRTFVDVDVSACRYEPEASLSYRMPVSDNSRLGSSCSSEPHHSSLHSGDSGLGTSGTVDFHSVGGDWHTPLEVSDSGYFTNSEDPLLQRQTYPLHSTPQETSLVHLPAQCTSQEDPPIVICRELVLSIHDTREPGKSTTSWPLGGVLPSRVEGRSGWLTGLSVSSYYWKRSWRTF